MTTRVGIDFGNANTVVAQWDEALGRGVAVAVPGIDLLRPGGEGVTQRVVPSLIAYAPDAAGRLRHWIGAQVTDQAHGEDAVVFRSAKSRVTGRTLDLPVRIGETTITARAAAAHFLGDVMALTVLAMEAPDVEVVATAPVEAFEDYRAWLAAEVAAHLPGARIRVVDEATAAAVGYAARMDPGDAFGVLDFGAGTLNVVVVRVVAAGRAGAGAGVRVVAKSGIDLGGADIDLLLARHAADQLGLPRTGASTRDRRFRRLLTSAEEAKITLTTSETAVVSAGRSGDVEITRRTFEDLLREHRMLGRAGQALRRTLDQAAASGYPSSSLMGLFLVGGTCLIPAVQRLVLDQFDPDLVRLDRPLEAVAAGAARLAGGHELHDHIQHDYAIRHRNPATGRYDFEPLATAGTAFPTKEPVHSLTIQAARRGQTKFGVAIYELAHATAGTRDAAPSGGLELVFDAEGNASAVPVTPRRHAERSQRWLNETAPTTLRADPPAEPGTDRFRLEFRIDERRRLTLSAFDMECGRWILDHHPVVELS